MVKQVERLDAVFHALADRTRREILAGLVRHERTISEIAAPFAMSLPAVSKHVRVLERAGLVRRSVRGRVHRIALDASPLETAESWLERHLRRWEERLDALSRVVERREE